MENPKENLSKLLTLVGEFGNLAGLVINRNKSKILLKNIKREEQEEIKRRSGCEISNKVKYLGVEVMGENIDLLRNNYEKLWENIQKDLIRWNKLNLSLLGRIATIKMNMLPKLLYLFQTIPIIKKELFLTLEKRVDKFYLGGEKTRDKVQSIL